MKQLFHSGILLPGLLLMPASASAQDTPNGQPGYFLESQRQAESSHGAVKVVRADEAPRIDGRLDDSAWADAPRLPLEWETWPAENAAAPVRTDCLVSYDERALYLACEAFDPDPAGIRAYITDRDDTSGHDRIVFSLDPFNDARRAFEFSVSARGVQGDAVFDGQGGGSDDSWDAIWHSSGRPTETGYVVEAAIPFRSLRFPATRAAQTWGFHARREWPRSRFVVTRSSRLERDDACTLCQVNLLQGFQGISPGVNVEINPTLTASRVDSRTGSAALVNGEIEPEPGLDLRWGISSDLALNLTANPDFSQVEADAPQVSVNNRFALFFPEKRPFFLEGADFFSTPLRAVFTRTVSDPIGGTKVTGKIGPNALGAMVTRDRVNNLLIPGNQGSAAVSLEDDVTGVIGRFRRDIGGSGTIGALYTGRQGEGYHNHVAGVDGFLRPLAPVSVRFQYLRSSTRYPGSVAANNEQPTSTFGGDAVRVEGGYSTRTWRLQLDGFVRDPGFRADAGFIPQTDVRGFNLWGRRNFWPEEGGFFTRLGVSGGTWRSESTSGRLTDEGVWMDANFDGPWQSNFWINPNLARRFFDGEVHETFELWSGGSIQPNGSLDLELVTTFGDAIDFRNSRKADQVRLRPSVGVRAGAHTDVRLSGTYQRVSVAGEEVFTALVSQLRLVYNFTPRVFARAILQVRNTERNPSTNPDLLRVRDTGLVSQLLFSYKLNPLTVLFVGYTDNRAGAEPVDDPTVPLTQTERSFFVKLGYAWRP